MKKPVYAKHEATVREALERLTKQYGWDAVRYACNRFLKIHQGERRLRRMIEAKRRELGALRRKLRTG